MKLKKLEVNSFAGINPNSPVIIDFTESKFVTASGDNAVGKTSLINALLVGCGAITKDVEKFTNLESGKIDVNLEFVGNDRNTYQVRATKSSFVLTYEGEKVSEPISKMKELLGVVGQSPMEIKEKPLKDIIRWLASYSNKSPEEFQAQMDKHKQSIKAAKDTRAAANKAAKALGEYLSNEPLFNDWEGSEKTYTKDVDIKELSAKLDEAGKKSDKLIQAEAKLKQLKERETSLTDQLQKIQEELNGVKRSIQVGENFIEENKGVKKEYDTIKKSYDNAAQQSVQFHKWQEIKRKKSEKDEFETVAQKADAQEKEIIGKVKELQADILPDLKGLLLVMEDTHENGKMIKEGLYWNGKNLNQLSESETWALVMELWRKYKVRIVIIDNYSSLGSLAVQILEKLAKDGCHILVSEMKREQKELQIIYK